MSWNGMDFKRVWFDDKLHMSTIDATLIYKEEEEAPKMKTKMSEATIQALHKSIAHWNDICYGMEKNIGVSKCALCSEFNRSYLQCGGCPLMQSMQCCYDDQSAYDKYALTRRGFCTVASANAAEAMLELLVSLLPRAEVGDKYDVYHASDYPVGCAHKWMSHSSAFDTGITTDGRNAFPQAKYVWEKVFEYQVCGPIPEMPSYEWAADLPRASFIWSWPEAKTKDGKCVTCGQVVKKKVTKYKVAYRDMVSETSSDYGDVCESSNYYVGEGAWDRAGLTGWEFVGLIKSTAKEFDA